MKNKYRVIQLLGLLTFLLTFLFFVLFIYFSSSAKTEVAEKTLSSFLNKNLISEQLAYKFESKNSITCNSNINTSFLIETKCSLVDLLLSSNINSNKDSIDLFKINNVELIFYTEILATSLKKIKNSDIKIEFKAIGLSIDKDFFIKGIDLSQEQITENIKQDLLNLRSDFENLKITSFIEINKMNKASQSLINIKSNLYSKNWSIENLIELIFQINNPIKKIGLSNDLNDSIVSEKTLVLPYEFNVLNSSFLLLALDKEAVKKSFYSYYKIAFNNAIDKREFNLNLLDIENYNLVLYEDFSKRVAYLLTVASSHFALSSEAPFVEGIKEIFNENFGVCYKVTRNKNEPLVPYAYISELMKVYPEAGMELNKKSFNRDIIPCISIQECQKKCKE